MPSKRKTGPSARSVRTAALLTCAALATPCLPAAAQDRPAFDFEAAERAGAVIGDVDVVIDNVFDTSNPEEDKALYRWANRVHVSTRRSVVESVLLFAPGDPFEARLLEESARLLRARAFVADAAIAATDYDADANTVDVEVWMRDAWSLEPEIKLSRSGGENEYGLGITDDNLFGTGKSLTVAYESDVDRHGAHFGYSDPNVGGGRTQLDVQLANRSDGDLLRASAGRPFFALGTRWSVTGSFHDETRVDSMYDLGEVVDEFRRDRRAFSLQGGRSRGLVEGRALRWLAGATYDEHRFDPAPGAPAPVLLPEDRKLVYPWVGFQLIEDDFRQVTDLNDIGRTEDIALGLDLLVRLGRSTTALGADRDATMLQAAARKGWEPGGAGRLFVVDSEASARWEDGDMRDALLSARAQYYRRNLGGRHLFSASLEATLSHALDADSQVLLGGDNSLRGYPLRYQSGERSAVVSLEQRFFTDWYPARLLRVGYAVFFDAGRVWGEDPRGTPSRGMLYDVGVGLRLTSPRSSSRSVIHIDLAFPLNGGSDVDGVQLVVEKKTSF